MVSFWHSKHSFEFRSPIREHEVTRVREVYWLPPGGGGGGVLT